MKLSGPAHAGYLTVLLVFVCVPRLSAYDCSAHPWIDEALRKWFRISYETARQSDATVEDSLKTIADIAWGKYPTGKTMGVLSYNSTTGLYDLHWELLHRHNEPHKPAGMQKVFERALAQHNADLVKALGARELKFIFGTEDFPIVDTWRKLRLPSFQMCVSPDTADVPVPDFTWEVYNQAQYLNNSWWDVRRLLLLKGSMLPWRLREPDLFMRGDAGVGYRKTLMPFMHEVMVNRSDIALFGVHVNIRSTGFYVSDLSASHNARHTASSSASSTAAAAFRHFTWLDNWCHHRYLVHTSGLTYSASLKYKLACGAVVVHFRGGFSEFYYPGLKPGVHLLAFPEANRDGLLQSVAPQLKANLTELEGQHPDTPPDMALAAREFAATQLTSEALACYWYKALVAYSGLYYAQTKADVPPEVKLTA